MQSLSRPRIIALIVGLMFTLIVFATFVLGRKTNEWDLTTTATLSSIISEPVQCEPGEQIDLGPQRDLTLRLPQGRTLCIDATNIYLKRAFTSDRLLKLEVYSPGQTLDSALVSASDIAHKFGFDQSRLRKWGKDAESAEGFMPNLFLHNNDENPNYSLSITHTFDRSSPWRVGFAIYWVNLD